MTRSLNSSRLVVYLLSEHLLRLICFPINIAVYFLIFWIIIYLVIVSVFVGKLHFLSKKYVIFTVNYFVLPVQCLLHFQLKENFDFLLKVFILVLKVRWVLKKSITLPGSAKHSLPEEFQEPRTKLASLFLRYILAANVQILLSMETCILLNQLYK